MEVEWTEHTAPDGRIYYFNRKTQVSSWDKPNELQSPEERSCVWREYVAEGNKVYFHNTVTKESVWTMPEELRQFKQKKAAAEAATVAAADPLVGYRQALEAANVPSNATWEQAMLATINDERYKAVANINDRKKVFTEYIEAKKKAEDAEKKAREEQRRRDFLALLSERKDVVGPRTTWKKSAPSLERDPRFYALEDEEEREEVFEEFVWDLEKKEKEAEKEARRVGAERFKELLADPAAGVSAATTWRRFREQFADDGRFKAADRLDRLRLFEEHVRALEKTESDARRLERDAQRRKSRQLREAFRAHLRQMQERNELTLQTAWSALVPSLAALPVYTDMLGTGYVGSTPRQLFDDVLDELDEAYERDKRRLKEQLRSVQDKLPARPTRDQVLETLRLAPNGEERLAAFKPVHVEVFVADVQQQEEEREREEQKRRMRELERLLDSLTTEARTALLAPDAAWAALGPSLEPRPPFAAARAEIRPQLFVELVAIAQRRAKEAAAKAEGERERDKAARDSKDERRERRGERDGRREGKRREEERDEKRSSAGGAAPAPQARDESEEEGAIVDEKPKAAEGGKAEKKEKREHGSGRERDKERDRSDRERDRRHKRSRHSRSPSPSRGASRSRSRSPRK